MNITVFGPTGKKTGTFPLPKEIFEAKVNQALLAQAVRVYRARMRRGTKKTKTRGMVQGSTIKIYRQKGTGRARHGARYAPIFVGGGIAHGPTGKENYHRSLTRDQRRQALISALTLKAKDNQVAIIDKLETLKPKTKSMHQTLKTVSQKVTPEKSIKKLSLILAEPIESIIRAARNLSGVTIHQARGLNAYEVLSGGLLIFAKSSLETLKQTLTQTEK